ncbi:hypothetical protein BDA96_01G074500 [Sorghum bicolor]|uniref:Uncharacterized protein n=2 Tax=Sorghum bicolor TaxID=4558 RepID=A0A921UXV7_SORBI|nr:hypothetical protein BDA96_01G074500 [Sorghum bicolor]KXG37451.1 hypothetical protein SORBI_3001G071900 [Sorghum bicolor]
MTTRWSSVLGPRPAEMEAEARARAGTCNTRRRWRGQAVEEDMCLGMMFVEEMLMEQEEQGTRGPCSASPSCEGRRRGRSRGATAASRLFSSTYHPSSPHRSCLARLLFFPKS